MAPKLTSTRANASIRHRRAPGRSQKKAKARCEPMYRRAPGSDVDRLANGIRFDPIVVGANGNSALYDRRIGQPQKIMHHAIWPVLAVR